MTFCVESIKQIQEQMRRGEEEWNAEVKRGDSYHIGGHITPLSGVPRGPLSRVIIKDYLAQTATETRSWRERLFTRPWRPWQRFKKVPGKPAFYTDRDGTIYTCPRGADELRKTILADLGIAP